VSVLLHLELAPQTSFSLSIQETTTLRASSIHQDSTPDSITENEHLNFTRKRELLRQPKEHKHQDKKHFVSHPSQSSSPNVMNHPVRHRSSMTDHIPSPSRRVAENNPIQLDPSSQPQQPVSNDSVSTNLEMLRSMQAQFHQTNHRVNDFIDLRSRSSPRRSDHTKIVPISRINMLNPNRILQWSSIKQIQRLREPLQKLSKILSLPLGKNEEKGPPHSASRFLFCKIHVSKRHHAPSKINRAGTKTRS